MLSEWIRKMKTKECSTYWSEKDLHTVVSFNLAADQNWRMSGITNFLFIGGMAKPAEPAG